MVFFSVCMGFRGGSVPEAGYDGSAASMWLDRFLAEDGLDYQAFLVELEGFDQRMDRGWGQRPSTWRWMPRLREWERAVPEMEGLSALLGRLGLEWSQHAYLDALTAYVDYNLQAMESTYGSENGRMRFFEAFTASSAPTASSFMLFDGDDLFEDEARDIISRAVVDIRGMLNAAQIEEASRIVSEEGYPFRSGRY